VKGAKKPADLHDPPTFNNSFCSWWKGDKPSLKPWWEHGRISPWIRQCISGKNVQSFH